MKFAKLSGFVLTALWVLSGIACKGDYDATSCRAGCNEPYFPCMEQALLYTRSPNGETPKEGGLGILWLGCEYDKAICKSNCGSATSAQ